MTEALIIKYPQHKIFDIKSTSKVETAKDIINLSFNETIADLKNQEKLNLSWSDFAKPRIQHMANLTGFSSEYLKAGGISDALNALYNGAGPSWRMVVELNDMIQADVIYPGGQSGNPSSPFYDNMINDWTVGKYQKAIFTKSFEHIPSLGIQSFGH